MSGKSFKKKYIYIYIYNVGSHYVDSLISSRFKTIGFVSYGNSFCVSR